MNRIISEELIEKICGLDDVRLGYPEIANQLRNAPVASGVDLSGLDIHSKQTCPVEDFVYVSDLATITTPAPSGHVCNEDGYGGSCLECGKFPTPAHAGQAGKITIDSMWDLWNKHVYEPLSEVGMERLVKALRQPVETVGVLPVKSLDQKWLHEFISEGFHTAFRKAGCSNESSRIHELISTMNDEEYWQIVDFVCSPLWDALRTQPQAPVVEVPTVEELKTCWRVYGEEGRRYLEGDKQSTMEAVHALLYRTTKPTVAQVPSVDLIEGSLYLNSTDDGDDGKWIEAKDYRKVAQAIHALLQSKGGR